MFFKANVQKLAVFLWCGLLFLMSVSCADMQDFPDETAGVPFTVTIWNRSQYEVEALTLVDVPSTDDSEQAGSLVGGGDVGTRALLVQGDAPLSYEQTMRVQGFVSGSRVSFVRERFKGGEKIEIISSQPFYPDSEGYTIVLFDDTFRLLSPDSDSNPYGVVEPVASGDMGQDATM